MPITKELLEEQIATLTEQREQLRNGIQQTTGAIELATFLLKRMEAEDKGKDPIATVPSNERPESRS